KDFDILRPHSVYIKILNPDVILDIVDDLKKQLHLSNKASRFTHSPSVEIACGLDEKKLSAISAGFCEQKYSTTFTVASLVLLKKNAREQFARYEMVREFRLEGKPVTQMI